MRLRVISTSTGIKERHHITRSSYVDSKSFKDQLRLSFGGEMGEALLFDPCPSFRLLKVCQLICTTDKDWIKRRHGNRENSRAQTD